LATCDLNYIFYYYISVFIIYIIYSIHHLPDSDELEYSIVARGNLEDYGKIIITIMVAVYSEIPKVRKNLIRLRFSDLALVGGEISALGGTSILK